MLVNQVAAILVFWEHHAHRFMLIILGSTNNLGMINLIICDILVYVVVSGQKTIKILGDVRHQLVKRTQQRND